MSSESAFFWWPFSDVCLIRGLECDGWKGNIFGGKKSFNFSKKRISHTNFNLIKRRSLNHLLKEREREKKQKPHLKIKFAFSVLATICSFKTLWKLTLFDTLFSNCFLTKFVFGKSSPKIVYWRYGLIREKIINQYLRIQSNLN